MKSPLKLDVCGLTHPFVDGNENEDRDNDDDLFDGRGHEDVVGNKLGGEVDAVGAAADSDPNNDLVSMLLNFFPSLLMMRPNKLEYS